MKKVKKVKVFLIKQTQRTRFKNNLLSALKEVKDFYKKSKV